MTLGEEQIEDTVRKTWSKDEAKFMTHIVFSSYFKKPLTRCLQEPSKQGF